MAIDFSDLGGKPVAPPSGPIDFSDLGGKSVQPSLLQKAAQLSAVPRNGLRGLATGIEGLVEGHGLQPSLADAAAASQQNYQKPQGDYGIANFAANALDPRMLATLALPGAGYAATAAKGALAAGGSNTLDSLENTGTVSPLGVAGSSVLGAITGGAAKGLGALVGNAPKIVSALGGGLKGLNTTAAMLRQGIPAAYDALATENPAALKAASGTFEGQRASAKALQDGIAARLEELGKPVGDAKAALGITPASNVPDDVVNQAQAALTPPPAPSGQTELFSSDPQGQLDLRDAQSNTANLDRIRQLAQLKDQVNQAKRNLFNNGNTDVLDKKLVQNTEADKLTQLYGQLNNALKQIPEAAPLNEANAAYSPAASAYDDVLQKQFGHSIGQAQTRISSLTTPLEDTAPEALAPDVKNAINTMGGNVPSLYQAAQAEAVKRAMAVPISSATRSTVKRLASAPPRMLYPYTLPLISGMQNAATPLAQALSSGAQSAQPAIPSLIEALMANSKQHQ